MNGCGGLAVLKPEFIVPKHQFKSNIDLGTSLTTESEPVIKKAKTDEDIIPSTSTTSDNTTEDISINDQQTPYKSKKQWRKEKRGQNKNRPMRSEKLRNDEKLCKSYIDGILEEPCINPEKCPFLHDVAKYIALPGTLKSKIDKECYVFKTYGRCFRGLTCLFSKSHTDTENKNMVNIELWTQMKPVFESTHGNILDRDTQQQLRTRKFDFSQIDSICNNVEKAIKLKREAKLNVIPVVADETEKIIKTIGPITDEDEIVVRPEEIKKVDWKNKLYLSPLTTVGNLPFRRLCVDFGADITCSEMSLANSILQGTPHEFALHRRHPSEKIWGVQLCASNAVVAAKACHILDKVGVEYDFVDLNMGCPLDNVFQLGAGSGLMCRGNKVESVAKTMSAVLGSKNKPFTVKMRAGVKTDKYIAHDLIKLCRDSGVSAVTLHGRTREQRYTKTANWDYIGDCVRIATPMSLFGNGDVLSWEEYAEKKSRSDVSGVMIGRGALMKPWIFQEIKEERNIDMTSSQRMEVIQRYCNYGLDHWGSDYQGVETTRRFLLEWLSFLYRYIPVGILEKPPQRINERPPKYFGRDEMETLLASPNAADWVKLSEMFLGPVPDSFIFLPKHKANSWS